MSLFGYREHQRARLIAKPLPEAWWNWIDQHVPYIARLGPENRAELAGAVQVLLEEKRFEGCGGLEITDEIRVTIAAQAAVLLLHRKTDYYPNLQSILVYPEAYLATAKRQLPGGVVEESSGARLGESWHRGALIVSWSDVLAGGADPKDGHNVVFHEFAHQIDDESGSVGGAPNLGSRARYREWATVLSAEYAQLIEALHAGHKTLLDAYGATSPAEFFAVATETFFERGAQMRTQHPELYRELAAFYQQDPAEAKAKPKTV